MNARIRAVCAVFVLALALVGGTREARAASAEQLVSYTGTLPHTGRVVIRSGLAWVAEDTPLFALVARALGDVLTERGLTVVATPPSRLAPYPPGMEAFRNRPVPPNPGRPPRIMSLHEASMRMKAMQLAREGRLPKTSFGGTKRDVGERPSPLTGGALLRFALSQEKGLPELRGRITIPGRLPEELAASDAGLASYAVTLAYAMLWPGSGIPDEPLTLNSDSGLAVGWHVLEAACYDLAAPRQGGQPKRVWSMTVQRVAFGAYVRGTLPKMVREGVAGVPEE